MKENVIKQVPVQERIYGLDIIRILSMYFVMLLHILLNGGILEAQAFTQLNTQIVACLYFLGVVAVNLFALLSGYLGINSCFKRRRIIELWLQVLFYSWLCLWGMIISQRDLGLMEIVKALFPTVFQQYWYFNAYLGVCFLGPLLKPGLKQLSQASFLKIILAGLFLFSVLGSIPGSDRYGLAGGYSVLWLVMMYLVGAYLKLHGYPRLKNVVYLGIYFLASLANLLISDSLSWVKVRFLHGDDKLFLGVVIAYTNPLLVLEAVCLFIWLLRFPIKSLWLQKSLLSLSPLSFGAYLLQTNPFVYTIITGAYTRLSIMKPWWLVLAVLGLAILWLLAGCLLDYVRNLIFRKLKLVEHCDNLFSHFFHYLAVSLKEIKK